LGEVFIASKYGASLPGSQAIPTVLRDNRRGCGTIAKMVAKRFFWWKFPRKTAPAIKTLAKNMVFGPTAALRLSFKPILFDA
jgi:hypothetical protein